MLPNLEDMAPFHFKLDSLDSSLASPFSPPTLFWENEISQVRNLRAIIRCINSLSSYEWKSEYNI